MNYLEADMLWVQRMLEESEETFGDFVTVTMTKERAVRLFNHFLNHLNEVTVKGLKYHGSK